MDATTVAVDLAKTVFEVAVATPFPGGDAIVGAGQVTGACTTNRCRTRDRVLVAADRDWGFTAPADAARASQAHPLP